MGKSSIEVPTKELMLQLADKVCLSDVKQCVARGYETPQEALVSVFERGEVVAVGCIDGKPVMALGVAKTFFKCVLANEGFIWIVASEEMRSMPVAVLKYSKRVIQNLLQYYDVLVSSVDSSDERSMKYDKFLGFNDTGIVQYKDGKTYKTLANYGI